MRIGPIHPSFNATVLAVFTTVVLLFWIGAARAGDAERGRLLYENHCTVCHTSVVHIREDRRATSREEIRNWIDRWQKELGLQWTSAEIDDVLEYLNDRYYLLKSDS